MIIIIEAIQSVTILSSDIRMKFGIKNCAVLVLKHGELVRSGGITLLDDTRIYKSNGRRCRVQVFRSVRADGMLHDEMKVKTWKNTYDVLKKLPAGS